MDAGTLGLPGISQPSLLKSKWLCSQQLSRDGFIDPASTGAGAGRGSGFDQPPADEADIKGWCVGSGGLFPGQQGNPAAVLLGMAGAGNLAAHRELGLGLGSQNWHPHPFWWCWGRERAGRGQGIPG